MSQSKSNPHIPNTARRDLLAACFDLLNDDISGEEWLGHLANLAGCESATCVWWRKNDPDSLLIESAGTPVTPPIGWFQFIDRLVDDIKPIEAFFVDEAFLKKKGVHAYEAEDGIRKDYLVACIDWKPACVVFIFSGRKGDSNWTDEDREQLSDALPIIRKSVAIKKKLSEHKDIIEFVDKAHDTRTHGVILIDDRCSILSANNHARRLLDTGDQVSDNSGHVRFGEAGIQAEFEAQVAKFNRLNPSELDSFSWYCRTNNSTERPRILVSMSAIRKEASRTESSVGDRALLLKLEHPESKNVPGELQLQKLYGLSRAQARLTRALMLSKNLEAAAESCNITKNTARTHLRAIYKKLGVDSQAKLMQLLSTSRA